MAGNKERQSNIELLRIVTMLLIVCSHFAGHGVEMITVPDEAYVIWNGGSLVNRLFTCFLNPAEISVPVLFMITGYFQIRRDRYSLKKLIVECFFYSVLSILLCLGVLAAGGSIPYMGLQNVATFLVRAVFMPLTSTAWWFVAVYVFLMLFSPAVNGFLRKLSRRGYIRFLLVFWIVWYGMAAVIGTEFVQLQRAVFFYAIGAFCRLHLEPQPKKKPLYLLTALLTWTGCALCYFQMGRLSQAEAGLKTELMQKFFSTLDSVVLIPVCAFCVFRFFSALDIGVKPFINKLAQTTFGIYLIHDSLIARPLLWYSLLDVPHRFFPSALFPLYAVLIILGIFAVCAFLDWLRILFVEPKLLKLADRTEEKLRKAFLKESV